MAVDLWVEVTEDNIKRLTDLYLLAHPEEDIADILCTEVVVGNYINYDTSYQALELQLDAYSSVELMHEFSRMVDIDELSLAVFENSLNQ